MSKLLQSRRCPRASLILVAVALLPAASCQPNAGPVKPPVVQGPSPVVVKPPPPAGSTGLTPLPEPPADPADIKGPPLNLGDVTVTPLNIVAKDSMVWADDKGTAFDVLDHRGTLRQISFPDFKVVKRKQLVPDGYVVNPARLALSAEGLLLSLPTQHELWLVDAETFEIKKQIAVPSIKAAASARSLSVAFAAVGEPNAGATLQIIDLKTGKAEKFAPGGDARFPGFDDPGARRTANSC